MPSREAAAPVAVGRLQDLVYDCAEPRRLARFWAGVYGVRVAGDDDDWVSLEPVPGGHRISFQRVPEPRITKNRLHVDVLVEDFAVATGRVRELGAEPLGPVHGDADAPWRVFADPEGNEFCLVSR